MIVWWAANNGPHKYNVHRHYRRLFITGFQNLNNHLLDAVGSAKPWTLVWKVVEETS